MKTRRFVLAFALLAGACAAQAISISGIVEDSAGVGIEGAVVQLEKAGITTVSAANGTFVLSGDARTVYMWAGTRFLRNCVASLRNGCLQIELEKGSVVAIGVYSLRGRKVYGSRRRMDAGTHFVQVGRRVGGIWLCTVRTSSGRSSLKGMSTGGTSGWLSEGGHTKLSSGELARRASPAQELDDVIAASKDGWLNYRVRVTNSDTSGIEIEMIPSAGTVGDADGNVYQTVRIGSQVWTAENLRTTKFNDGTEIPEVIDAGSWRGRTTPAYCYHPMIVTGADTVKHGALYNGYAMGTNKFAPHGWHVPSEAEWDTLQGKPSVIPS